MELSPSWYVNSLLATQKFASLLWNLKVHYRFQKSPELVHILSQINSVHNSSSYFSKIHSHIILLLCLRLPSGLFPSGVPANIFYAFLFFPIRATYLYFSIAINKVLCYKYSKNLGKEFLYSPSLFLEMQDFRASLRIKYNSCIV
jgi:hypothetical protein